MAPGGMGGLGPGHHPARSARNSGGSVYLFRLLTTAADAGRWLYDQSRVCTNPGSDADRNFDVSPFLCGVIALSLLYAAYASQTLRGALKAVPLGQWESGQALGLSKAAIFFRLVMPQMWRHALPGLGNQWLVLLKDTALVSLISVNDLMLQTKSIATRTRSRLHWYIVAAAIYLVITLVSQYILKRIDLRATRFERRPG